MENLPALVRRYDTVYHPFPSSTTFPSTSSPSQVTSAENWAPPNMMGLPLASWEAIRKVAGTPATAVARPVPLAWQHESATCVAEAVTVKGHPGSKASLSIALILWLPTSEHCRVVEYRPAPSSRARGSSDLVPLGACTVTITASCPLTTRPPASPQRLGWMKMRWGEPQVRDPTSPPTIMQSAAVSGPYIADTLTAALEMSVPLILGTSFQSPHRCRLNCSE
mmetsp:Transcript_7157/g.20975  ORF Transcript_7157/g.20975 Transcript_7157/m.20975 type:complete len:223 (+) Transcript_7157:1903-2571(+)